MVLLMIEHPSGNICLRCNPREPTELERLRARVEELEKENRRLRTRVEELKRAVS
jgi:predicted RNase H-like nuclease (RuvC/YqgF family)